MSIKSLVNAGQNISYDKKLGDGTIGRVLGICHNEDIPIIVSNAASADSSFFKSSLDRFVEEHPTTTKGIIFIDEFGTAPQEMKDAILNLYQADKIPENYILCFPIYDTEEDIKHYVSRTFDTTHLQNIQK